MAVDTSVIGCPTGAWRIVIERGPATNFAKAVKAEDPVFHDPTAARGAGLAGIAVVPTYGFAMANWGVFAEDQPEGALTPGEVTPVMKVIGEWRKKGGMILHGEQEFTYLGPICVGDVLVGEGSVVDLYERESKGRTMTFLVTENSYRNEATGDVVLKARMNLVHRS